MKDIAQLTIPYAPRPLQQDLHMDSTRFKVLVCHRRFGKTVWAINQAISRAISCYGNEMKSPRVAYIAPLLKQARTVAWDYAKEFLSAMPGYKPNEGNLHIDFLGNCRLNLYGSDNPDAARGIYLDDVVLDEYAQMSPKMWSEIIRPALSDRRGTASFIGTPKGKNNFFEIYERAVKDESGQWAGYLYKASDTQYVDKGELDFAAGDMSEEEYAQEYECSWEAAIRGAYYGKIMESITKKDQVTSVPYESSVPVITAWDLGIDDMTAIWFCQRVGKEIRLIDYYESSGVGLNHYVQVLRERDYTYGDHYLPHDVRVKEMSSGKSRLDVLRSLGLTQIRVVPKISLEDGINAVRTILTRCWFDAKSCNRGVEALRQYRTDYDDRTQTYRNRPLHDWTSHPCDAFRYLAISLHDPIDPATVPRLAQQDYNIFDPMGHDNNLASSSDWVPW